MPITQGLQRHTLTYFTAFAALGLAPAALGPSLPSLAAQTGSSLEEISFLFIGRSIGYLPGALLAGRLYDRLPGHPILALALLVMAVCTLMVPHIPSLVLLVLLLIVLGTASGTLDVGGNTLLLWSYGERVGPWMNALHFTFGIGAFVSPLIIAYSLTTTEGIGTAYLVMALLTAPMALLVLRYPSPTPDRPTAGKATAPNDRRLVLLVMVFFFLYAGTESSIGGWLYTYALEMSLTNASGAAYLTSGFWGLFTLGRLLGIPLAARYQPRHLLLGHLGLGLVGLGLIYLGQSNLVLTWAGTILMGLALASIFPLMLSFMGRQLPMDGKITSRFFIGASIGGMTWPWLIGQWFETLGPTVFLHTLLLDLLTAMVLFALILRHCAAPRTTG